MLQSKLFTKTRREAPKGEEAVNARLLIQAGFVHKEMSGVYALLTLGLRVIKKIENIVRQEMETVGGQEIEMTALQSKEVWESAGRWNDEEVDSWFKTELRSGNQAGLAFTHEEPLSFLMKDHIRSAKDLPIFVYQFQTKFRNEERAKSGLIRGREFLMKDLYSFCENEEDHKEFYEKMKQAYSNIFKRCGLGDRTYLTFASGGSFSEFSHEFQTLTDVGEDTIYVDENQKIAVNKEIYTPEVLDSLELSKDSLVEKKAVEVGNIFTLGTRFSEAADLAFKDGGGNKLHPFMGSYGIGLQRIMGTVAEILSDDKGLVWPKTISPFEVHLILVGDNGEVKEEAEEIYKSLTDQEIEVLFDDRELRAGEKFNDADLIGIPKRVVVSEKTLESGELEITDRQDGSVSMMPIQEALSGGIRKLVS